MNRDKRGFVHPTKWHSAHIPAAQHLPVRLPAPAKHKAVSGIIECVPVEPGYRSKPTFRAVYFGADQLVMDVKEAGSLWELRDILTFYEPAYFRAPARAHKDC